MEVICYALSQGCRQPAAVVLLERALPCTTLAYSEMAVDCVILTLGVTLKLDTRALAPSSHGILYFYWLANLFFFFFFWMRRKGTGWWWWWC